MSISRKISTHLARFLSVPGDELSMGYTRAGDLAACVRKGDVLLVEGPAESSVQ